MSIFKQISKNDWVASEDEYWDNHPIAQLSLSPEELSSQLGLTFEDDFDNLDYFKIAVIEIDNGHRFSLLRYEGESQEGTTTIYAPWFQEDVPTNLERYIAILGLSENDLSCKISQKSLERLHADKKQRESGENIDEPQEQD